MKTLTVTDDSGFLAIVDTTHYSTFVSEEWDFPMLKEHFLDQMRKFSLLIWGTGREGRWTVSVQSRAPAKAKQSIEGFLRIGSRGAYLTNYEDLSMAAQFSDIALPLQHNAKLVVGLDPGLYKVSIYRTAARPETEEAHFVLNLIPCKKLGSAWSEIPWSKV